MASLQCPREDNALPSGWLQRCLLLQHLFRYQNKPPAVGLAISDISGGQLPSRALAEGTDRLVPECAVCAGEVSVGDKESRHCHSASGGVSRSSHRLSTHSL